MFNIINNKVMVFINQLLIILLVVLSVITVQYMNGKYLQIIGLFILVALPYALSTSRSRDFMQVDIICLSIMLSLFVFNIIGMEIVRLYGFLMYTVINVGIVLFGYLFQIILYCMVFKVSEALSEYKRFNSAIESITFVHSVNVFITLIVFVKLNQLEVGKLYLLQILALIICARIVTKLIVTVLVGYNVK